MNQKSLPRVFFLDYLREYPLGKSAGVQRRNVALQLAKIPNLQNRLDVYDHSTFCWWHARKLENREEVADSEGIWPINCWRCERRIGIPGADIFTQDMRLNDASATTYSEAREMRRLCYFRVSNAIEASHVILAGDEVRYATKVTPEWYDPDNGRLAMPSEASPVLGSHAVPLTHVDRSNGQSFVFRNSWGLHWGDHGLGSISFEHFDRFMIEAWVGLGGGTFVPYEASNGIICLEWKCSLNDWIGVHCREIVDAETTERVAWAFCTKRGGFLDVEEFFVWPSERGKGYGRVLAKMVGDLASSMSLPRRLLVSYADTEPANESNLQAAARLLGVKLFDANERWVHMMGRESALPTAPGTIRPQRPALMLERLRPKDEKPIDSPIEYGVFFGTNRRLSRNVEARIEFSGERDSLLRIGISRVTIPRTHRFGCKGRWWTRFWNWLTGKQPRLLENRLFANELELRADLSPMLKAFKVLDPSKDRRHNLLYVHGFNVGFDDAILHAAHLGVDLKIPGATFVFSWPSAGRLGSYSVDEASIEASLPFFEEFIHKILANTEQVPLSIIVHSMGNRAVLRFLESAAREQESFARGRIRNLILAAPDVDTEVFISSAQRILPLSERTTMYATRGDLALQASEWLHKYSRAGLAPPVVTVPGMDTVLVEGFNLLDLGHGYHAEAASTLHDIFILLHYGSEPQSRPALISAETNAGAPFWKLRI